MVTIFSAVTSGRAQMGSRTRCDAPQRHAGHSLVRQPVCRVIEVICRSNRPGQTTFGYPIVG